MVGGSFLRGGNGEEANGIEVDEVDVVDGRLDKEYLFRALLLPPVKEFIQEEREDLMDVLDIADTYSSGGRKVMIEKCELDLHVLK